MRAAGDEERLTLARAQGWMADPETAPEWFSDLVGEKLAAAAQAEFRKVQAEEEHRVDQLQIEQSAMDKLERGVRRFTNAERDYVEDWASHASNNLLHSGPGGEVSEEDRYLLGLVGVNANNHATWWIHATGCEGEGPEHCKTRIEEMHASRRVDALLVSVAKQTALTELALTVGDVVTTWDGARAGVVVKLNKVTVKVRMVGGRADKYVPGERNLDPRFVHRAPDALPVTPAVGDTVQVRDYHGGRLRTASVVDTDGPMFEATYALKSKQWRSAWFDVTMLLNAAEHVAVK